MDETKERTGMYSQRVCLTLPSTKLSNHCKWLERQSRPQQLVIIYGIKYRHFSCGQRQTHAYGLAQGIAHFSRCYFIGKSCAYRPLVKSENDLCRLRQWWANSAQ